MNFLSDKTGIATGTDDYADNSLVLWNDHDNGTVPYSYAYQLMPCNLAWAIWMMRQRMVQNKFLSHIANGEILLQ
ncbi:MAG: hypothetical protein R2753_00935 [Chitinophagales bacterium]